MELALELQCPHTDQTELCVSIRVIVELALELKSIKIINALVFVVSILVIVELALELFRTRRFHKRMWVSILVIVELALERHGVTSGCVRLGKFQSLYPLQIRR